MKKAAFLSLLILLGVVAFGQQTPAPPQGGSILITGATVHVGDGTVIENGAVGFDNGKIIFVGTAAEADKSAYRQVVDATGRHVYPGFIAANSTLGLREIDAVRPTRDYDETGRINPNVRALIAYNTDSKIVPTVRSNGILMGQITPRGGLVSGTSSVVVFDAWNWEDAAYAVDDGIHINWPRSRYKGNPWREEEGIRENKQKNEQLGELHDLFDRAAAYAKEAVHAETNLKLEAMKGLFDGSAALYIHADVAKEITEAVLFARGKQVRRIVIVGGADAWMVAPLLKEHNVAVVLRRLHELPLREDEDVDLPFRTPYLLQQAGVLYCLQYEGDMEAMGTRNLPFTAGTAAAYGLTKEEALAAITLSVARILGIEGRAGSLAVGKDATLFISTGDALDMRTNNVELAFILGRSIDLGSHQSALYRKFAKKLGLEVKE